MSVEEGLQSIAQLVQSKEFREKQSTFFDKWCSEFEEGEENKLSYTTIHKEYEEQVEEDIKSGVGAECLERVVAGLEKFVETRGETEDKSPEILETIDLLTSLSDFEAFKETMLERRRAIDGRSAGPKADMDTDVLGNIGVIQIDGVMDTLRQAAEAGRTGGWEEYTSTADGSIQMDSKRDPDGTIYLRWAIGVEYSPSMCKEMFAGLSNPEYSVWSSAVGVKSAEILRDFGPEDKVYELEMAMPRALKYIMSWPDKGHLRLLTRSNWPHPGHYAYATVPYDTEKNICVQKMGPFKMESAIFSPIEGEQGCRVVGISLMEETKYIPKWGLSWMMKKMVPGMVKSVGTAFKKSKTYERMLAEEKEGK